MKAILLAAGYSKRLGELTANMPKALLTLNEKPILNYLIEKLEKIENVSVYIAEGTLKLAIE